MISSPFISSNKNLNVFFQNINPEQIMHFLYMLHRVFEILSMFVNQILLFFYNYNYYLLYITVQLLD